MFKTCFAFSDFTTSQNNCRQLFTFTTKGMFVISIVCVKWMICFWRSCSAPCRSVLFCSVSFCFVLLRSLLIRSVLFLSVPFYSSPFRSIPLRSVLFLSVPFYSDLFYSVPFCSVPFVLSPLVRLIADCIQLSLACWWKQSAIVWLIFAQSRVR